MNSIVIDHADIVVTHECNNHCPHCIDKFINSYDTVVKLDDIEVFLDKVSRFVSKETEVLLLGGEPTTVGYDYLVRIADVVTEKGFVPIISTNNRDKALTMQLTSAFRWVQITIHNLHEIGEYLPYKDKINIKLAGDRSLTWDRFNSFIEATSDFERRSISMYFTPDFIELCTDERVWEVLDTLEWQRNGSYLYAFYKGVRIKRCIKGETNIINEPSVPKLYPTGAYNQTWCNEVNDDYLG